MSRPESRPPESAISGVAEADTATRGWLHRLLGSELLVDTLACLPLAAGLTLALAPLTILRPGLWDTLGRVLLILLLLLLLRLRWWVTPVLLLLPAGGRTLYLYTADQLPARLEHWLGFLRWTVAGCPPHPDYSELGFPLLETLLTLTITALCFVLVRKLFSFLLILGLSGSVCVLSAVVAKADIGLALPLLVAALILLLPRVHAHHVARLDGHSRTTGRAAMQVAAVPAAALALLVSLTLIPEDTSAWQSRGLRGLAHDVGQLVGGPFQGYPANAGNFSLQRLGFQPEGDRLGGPVTPGDERVLLVNTPTPVLLRGAVRDHYTGLAWWVGAPDGDFRFDSLFWRHYRRESFDLDRPAGREAAELYRLLTRETELSIHYANSQYSPLFAPGRVREITFPDRKLDQEPFYNMRGELYLHLRVPARTRITVQSETWNRWTPGFDGLFTQLEALTADVPDPRYDELLSRHTQLPETLPDEVHTLAEEITADAQTPYAQAAAIEEWLTEHCTYTLTPATPPAEVDFVTHFLETREGYCTYYASAMGVLARCVGLPTRYVTGFALENHPDNDALYLATERTAHAWTEIYFRGIGWVEFDPLQWDAGSPLNEDAPVPEDLPDTEGDADHGSASSRGASNNGETGREDPGAAVLGAQVRTPVILLISLAVVAALILLRIAFRVTLGRKNRAFRLERVQRRHHTPGACLDHYYSDTVRQLSLLGLFAEPGETLSAFADRVDRHIHLEEARFAEIAEARSRQHFAGTQPTNADVEQAARYHAGLEHRLRDRLGTTGYFLRRAIR